MLIARYTAPCTMIVAGIRQVALPGMSRGRGIINWLIAQTAPVRKKAFPVHLPGSGIRQRWAPSLLRSMDGDGAKGGRSEEGGIRQVALPGKQHQAPSLLGSD